MGLWQATKAAPLSRHWRLTTVQWAKPATPSLARQMPLTDIDRGAQLDLRFARFFSCMGRPAFLFPSPANCSVSASSSLLPGFIRPQIDRIPYRRPILPSGFAPAGRSTQSNRARHTNPPRSIRLYVHIRLLAASQRRSRSHFSQRHCAYVPVRPSGRDCALPFSTLRTFASSICHDADSGCLLDQLDRILSFRESKLLSATRTRRRA